MSADASDVPRIQDEGVVEVVQRNAVAGGVDSMLAVLLVPLGNRRGLVHVLDDLPPADSSVVGTE